MYRSLPYDSSTYESEVITDSCQFVAPEVSQGQTKDSKADMWNLGMICYHILVGKSPHTLANNLNRAEVKPNDTVVYPPEAV